MLIKANTDQGFGKDRARENVSWVGEERANLSAVIYL